MKSFFSRCQAVRGRYGACWVQIWSQGVRTRPLSLQSGNNSREESEVWLSCLSCSHEINILSTGIMIIDPHLISHIRNCLRLLVRCNQLQRLAKAGKQSSTQDGSWQWCRKYSELGHSVSWRRCNASEKAEECPPSTFSLWRGDLL